MALSDGSVRGGHWWEAHVSIIAEIFVTDTLWPDFRGSELLEAIEAFQKRERRFGGLIGDGHSS